MIKNALPVYALCFLAGVLVLQFQELLPSRQWLLIFVILASVAFISSRSRWLALVLAGFVWAGFHGHQYISNRPNADIAGIDITVTGKVVELPGNDVKVSRFLFEIDRFESKAYKASKPERVRLSWYYPETRIEPGQQWRLLVRLKPPNGFQNPGGFDYESWLYQQGIHATGYVRKSEVNRLLATDSSLASISQLRFVIRQRINQLVMPETAPLVNALSIGYRGLIRPQTWRSFINTGTSHLMAISGLHIGLVAGFAWLVFRQFARLPGLASRISRRHLLVLSFMAALFYAGLAGFTVPTQRALIMLATVYLGLFLHRQVSVLQSLSVALIAVLVFSPVSVLSPGFWLSFLAVSVLAYSISGKLPGRQRLLYWFWPQLAVVIMLLPVSLYFFQQSSTVAILANLVAIPVVSLIILPLLLLALVCQFVSISLAGWIYLVADKLISLLLFFLDTLATMDFSLWQFPQPGLVSLMLALLGMFLLFVPYGFPSRWLSFCLFLPLLTNAGQLSVHGPATGRFEIHVIDVGQGLSVLVKTKGHNLLFDTGARFSSRFDAGERVVIPFLKYQRVSSLDMLMISNGDRDHIGGAAAIIRQMPVVKLFGQDINQLEHNNRTPCQRGQHWIWDGVSFEVLHPDTAQYKKRNNYSCVLKISNNRGAVLITADIENLAERSLVEAYGEKLQSKVIIVPHHGSKTSSSTVFLEYVKPELAIISAGYLNRYRLPHPDISHRYQQQGVRTLSTTDSGHIGLEMSAAGDITAITEYRHQYSRYWHRQNSSLYQVELSN